MSSRIKVGVTNVNSLDFTREQQKLVRTLRGNQYISVEDVRNLSDTKKYANIYDNSVSARRRGFSASEKFDESGRFSQEAIDKITQQLLWVPRVYRSYYLATLNAVADVLANPQQKMPVGSYGNYRTYRAVRRVQLNLDRLPTQRGLLNQADVVLLTSGAPRSEAEWKRLSGFTIKMKKQMGKEALQYWRHTGLLSKTFRTYKNEQVRNAALAKFTGAARVSLRYAEGENQVASTKVNGKRCFAATIQYDVSVPRWTNTLDMMITDPFMGDVSTFTETRKGMRAVAAKISKGKVLTPTSAIQKIASVEANRPWLRKLAYLAGQNMRKHLKDINK